MKLKFQGIADYVIKRRNLVNEFQELERQLSENLSRLQFSESDLGALRRDSIGRDRCLYYLILEKLIEENPSFVLSDENSRKVLDVNFGRGYELLGYNDNFVLILESRMKNLEPHLNFFSDLYDLLPGEKSVWLIGENTNSDSRKIKKGFRPINHFDTKKLVETINIFDLVNVPLEESPRGAYDAGFYYSFFSNRGFAAVADYCRRYPIQFNEVIIKTQMAIFPPRLNVERDRTGEISTYSARIELRDQQGDLFVEVGKIADRYFVNGQKT